MSMVFNLDLNCIFVITIDDLDTGQLCKENHSITGITSLNILFQTIFLK